LQKWNLPEGTEREGLVIQGNRQFCGAVFLTREAASDLKILVNREGFCRDQASLLFER